MLDSVKDWLIWNIGEISITVIFVTAVGVFSTAGAKEPKKEAEVKTKELPSEMNLTQINQNED